MIELVQVMAIFVGLTFLGYGLLRWPASSALRTGERLLLGLALALGLIPLVLLLVLLAGATLDAISRWLVVAGACLGFGLWLADTYRPGRRGSERPPEAPFPRNKIVRRLLALVIVALVIERFVFAAIQGLAFPTYFWDAVANWNYRAKVLHAGGQLDLNPQSETFLGGVGAHYPLGPSLFRAWVATLMGGWSEPAAATHSIAIYFLLFAIVWVRLSRKAGWWLGLVFAYVTISIPLMAYHAYAGYADLAVSFFFTGCLIYGYEYLTTRDQLMGTISALFLASALFTKNEGIVLMLPAVLLAIGAAMWSGRVTLRSAAIYLAVALGPVTPWIALKTYLGLPYAPTESNAGFAFHLEAIPQLFSVVFLQGSFNLFGLFFVLTLVLFANHWWKTELRLLAFPVFLFIGAVLAVFLFTDNYEFLANQMTINRTLMIAIPGYVYLVGISFARLSSSSPETSNAALLDPTGGPSVAPPEQPTRRD